MSAIGWQVATRRDGRITEYISADGRWTLWSQPFTPVWHARHDGNFVKDFTRVSAARAWVETEGEAFVTRYARELAAAPPVVVP